MAELDLVEAASQAEVVADMVDTVHTVDALVVAEAVADKCPVSVGLQDGQGGRSVQEQRELKTKTNTPLTLQQKSLSNGDLTVTANSTKK